MFFWGMAFWLHYINYMTGINPVFTIEASSGNISIGNGSGSNGGNSDYSDYNAGNNVENTGIGFKLPGFLDDVDFSDDYSTDTGGEYVIKGNIPIFLT